MPIVVITSSATSNEVIEAMKLGAFDHLSCPLEVDELDSVIKRATIKPRPPAISNVNQIAEDFLVGLSPVMRQIEKVIGIAATCDAPVLIVGETGTGKDTVARTIHSHSKHKSEPLTIIDCTAVPEDYQSFQSLFPGRKGSVILDEIGDLNSEMQAMLVRALKEAPIKTVLDASANLRIIATTQYDLVGMVKDKKLREDLYYRLNVLSIILPPLRERGSDILALAENFLQQAHFEAPKKLSGAAAKILLEYAWPGNVRQLQNLMYHLTATVRSLIIDDSNLSSLQSVRKDIQSEEDLDYYRVLATVEKRLLKTALEKSNGSRIEAARLLGINRQLLYAKLKAHQLMN